MAVPDGSPAQAVGALDRLPPWVLTVAAATSIQFGAALATTIFDELGPSATTFLRLLFAAVVLMIVVRPRVRSYGRADLRLAAAFGAALGLMNLTFYLALDRIPLGIAVTIEFAGPLGVAVVLSRRRTDVAWAALAAVGIVLLARTAGGGTGGLDPLGLAFALGAAACWAAYILIAKRAGGVFAGGNALALASVVAALVPLVPGVLEGGTELVEPRFLLIGLLVALASSVVPYSLEFEALRRLPSHVFGVLMSLEPAVAALVGLVVLGQDLGAWDLVAMACVVAASIGVTLSASSWRSRSTSPTS